MPAVSAVAHWRRTQSRGRGVGRRAGASLRLPLVTARVGDDLAREALGDLPVARDDDETAVPWVLVDAVLAAFAHEHGAAVQDAADEIAPLQATSFVRWTATFANGGRLPIAA